MREPKIDRVIFGLVVFVVIATCIPLGLMPERAGTVVSELYDSISHDYGILYQWAGIGTIVFAGWLAFGPYGHIKLGGEGERPDFSTFSWAGMLFCAGTGASLMVLAGIDWIHYYEKPPFAAQPQSMEAIQWATAYGPFHWGVTAWCIYAVATVAIAYPFYVQRVPHLCASTGCLALLGPAGNRSPMGRAIDLLAMIAILGGSGTSLGVVAPTIASATAALFGIETSMALEMGVIVFSVVLFGISVYLGLEKGIKRLSDFNVVIALSLLAYILVVGPTLFIAKVSTDTLGFMAENFVRMMTWTDPVENTGFVEAWSIFYWAWWISFAPIIGIFVSRISRGRTIRQVVVSMVFFGCFGCWIFYFVMGNYALFLQIEGIVPVTRIFAEQGMDAATTAVLLSLPFGKAVLLLFAVICIVSVATTYDSASYTLAAAATVELEANTNPNRWHRLFWALLVGVLPLFVLAVGGLQIIRISSLIASFPVLFIGIAMVVSLVKSLRQSDHASSARRLS
jgi:BCCT family betaine/carnitine transporter